MNSENHLFILWSKSLYKKDVIINDIAKTFKILKTYNVSWSQEKFSENLSRFYGEKLPSYSEKQKHCGVDDFICIVIKDENPCYQSIDIGNNRGFIDVNINVYNKKKEYREWTGGGHRVHATNDTAEYKHDSFLLFGLDECNLLDSMPPDFCKSSITNWKYDLIGSKGWDSFNDVTYALSLATRYVILRGEFTDELFKEKDDVDILVENRTELIYLLNAKHQGKKHSILRYQIFVSGKPVHIDINFVGDGNYDASWQKKMLDEKITVDGLFNLSNEHRENSNLYHEIIHKGNINEDKIVELNSFLLRNSYNVLEPKDITVKYFRQYFENSQRKSLFRVFYEFYCGVRWSLHVIKNKIAN